MSALSGAASNAAPVETNDAYNEPIAGEYTALPKSQEQVPQPTESWWQRITKRVIQDLIGLDENTLSVIFGEQLPEDPSPTPTPQSPIASSAARHDSRVTFRDTEYHWETRFLERIARELGVLINQLAEHDGRAFSTYQSILEVPEYAGLPPMHEQQEQQQRQPSLRSQRRRKSSTEPGPESAPSDALFMPTLAQTTAPPGEQPDTSLWGIEEEPHDRDDATLQERAYWERDIDVNMIFSYLRRRFSSSGGAPVAPQPESTGPLPASWATTNSTGPAATATAAALGTSPESLRRAELIRQQHPLVSRAATTNTAADRTTASPSVRRDSLLRRYQLQQLHHKRAGSSSCASQSTKRSRRSRSTSSRNYWDLGGGSVGSLGSGGGGTGRSSGLGGWGEV
ncbi:hypothetical protein KC318_g6284 [Hortaea werneckii]|nr:hypothetical protein KC318_g6284 [Hortaea werneckii]